MTTYSVMTVTTHGGAPVARKAASPPPSRPCDAITYQGESKSCPTCTVPVPPGFGRPRTYCSDQCRREMARRRHELADKEAELADARQKAADGYRPGRYFWDGMAAMHERQLAELRHLVPEHLTTNISPENEGWDSGRRADTRRPRTPRGVIR